MTRCEEYIREQLQPQSEMLKRTQNSKSTRYQLLRQMEQQFQENSEAQTGVFNFDALDTTSAINDYPQNTAYQTQEVQSHYQTQALAVPVHSRCTSKPTDHLEGHIRQPSKMNAYVDDRASMSASSCRSARIQSDQKSDLTLPPSFRDRVCQRQEAKDSIKQYEILLQKQLISKHRKLISFQNKRDDLELSEASWEDSESMR